MPPFDEKKFETSVQVHASAASHIYSEEAPGLRVDRVYNAKARLLNNAIQEIGMGKYQVRPEPHLPSNLTNLSPTAVAVLRHRFWVVCRQSVACMCDTPAGDVSDAQQVVTSLILDPVVNEFSFKPPFLRLGQASVHF